MMDAEHPKPNNYFMKQFLILTEKYAYAIEEAFKEKNEYWINLKDGYEDYEGMSTIHETNLQEIKLRLLSIIKTN